MKRGMDRAISRVETVPLGGRPQKILLEGGSAHNPIVLALHGGPGSPIPFGVGCRGLFPDFTDRCILVCWDQYGCGANNAPLPEDFGIEDFAEMTVDLIRHLKAQFPGNRLYLFGMSWGSILSVLAANRAPQMVDGVLAYGQVTWKLLQSEDTLAALLASVPEKIRKQAQRIFVYQELSAKNALLISKWVRKYTEGYVNKSEPKAPLWPLVKGLLTSPDYRPRDVLAVMVNGCGKSKRLIEDLTRVDLRSELLHVRVPYHILQGQTDVVTSTRQAVALVEKCGNPLLTCTVIPNAAHMPGRNGMNAILEEIGKLT